jgi:tetrahydromethanopterin S-methyltransferase subunit G
MRDSVNVIEDTEREFAKRFGRKYGWDRGLLLR